MKPLRRIQRRPLLFVTSIAGVIPIGGCLTTSLGRIVDLVTR